ncbi:class F sortase [Micromonospora sp. DT46]|uniref:class F sortase n=1 Tax=Micromonospora sp. DT46 TaxID=3393435 RepID=UPI003CF6CC1C
MSWRRPGWAATVVVLLATTGLGLVAAGLATTPPRPPRPEAAHAPAPARSAPSVPPLHRAAPVDVRIPAIDVRARIVPVGADADGHLEVPPLDRPTLAGWYRHGVSPGETGNAVLVGHVDSAAGPAVFFDLGRLRPGDTVRITRADASVATFAVDGVGSYPKDHFPTDLVYGPSDATGLRLITCGGRFDRDTGNYVDNVIVFATRVP